MLKQEIKDLFAKANKKEYRKFGITIGVVFIVISSYLFWKLMISASYFLGFGILFIALGLFLPGMLKYLYMVWMGFATLLGYFMSRVILSIAFFILFMPIGLFIKLIGKDLLSQKINKNTSSYWIKRERNTFDPKSAENQY
jgi:hypothetical protein